MPKIICLSGKAQHGKDTTANYLRFMLEAFGKRVLIIHQADLLKFICKQLFLWDGAKNEQGRRLLQYIGTDVVRTRDQSFWVNFVIKLIKLFGENWDYVLIPDCRFQNEIMKYAECGLPAIHIRVIRPFFNNGLSKAQRSHSSETDLDDIIPDYVVYNRSTVEELYTQVAPIFIKHRSFFSDISDLTLDLWKHTEVIT